MCAFAYFAIYTLNGNTIEVRFMICNHNINYDMRPKYKLTPVLLLHFSE